jgi:hypothetical protein
MKNPGNIGDYLQKRAAELGLDRADQLAEIQAYLDRLYPGQCRAASLNDGVLKITTPNASMASELRMRQAEIIGSQTYISRLLIQIN